MVDDFVQEGMLYDKAQVAVWRGSKGNVFASYRFRMVSRALQNCLVLPLFHDAMCMCLNKNCRRVAKNVRLDLDKQPA